MFSFSDLYLNGRLCDQEWKEDKACGHGKKTFSCGDYHEGEYVNDKRHGYGIYKWANGDEYEGQWANGKMNGKGTKRMADGSVYEGVSAHTIRVRSQHAASNLYW